jgi:uncharacterized protein YdeI (BOF family)
MNNIRLRLGALLLTSVGMLALSAHAIQQPATHDSQQPVAAQQQNDMQAQEAKPFNGTIVKEQGKFVLRDSATKISYQLDDQEKAKQFEGKQVKVTGKLDAATKLIHVENIEGIS